MVLNFKNMVQKIKDGRIEGSLRDQLRQRVSDSRNKASDELKRKQSFLRVTDSEGRISEDVVFLKEDNNDVLAVFPNSYGFADNYADTMTCYEHVGQHSTCTYDYVDELTKASEKDYAPLYNELKSVGYNVNVVDMPSKEALEAKHQVLMDLYMKHVEDEERKKIADSAKQMLKRGDVIEYEGKQGKVLHVIADSKCSLIGWMCDGKTMEFEVANSAAAKLKVKDAEDDEADAADDNTADTNADNTADENTDAADEKVEDACGAKKRKVRIFNRNKK